MTFPVVVSVREHELGRLSRRLKRQFGEPAAELISASHSITGGIRYERFPPRIAKPILDDIDTVLPGYFGFAAEIERALRAPQLVRRSRSDDAFIVTAYLTDKPKPGADLWPAK